MRGRVGKLRNRGVQPSAEQGRKGAPLNSRSARCRIAKDIDDSDIGIATARGSSLLAAYRKEREARLFGGQQAQRMIIQPDPKVARILGVIGKVSSFLVQRGKKGGKGKKDRKGGSKGESPQENRLEFPHKGKHRPPPGAAGDIRRVAPLTNDGNSSLYLSANPAVVIALENAAREAGYELGDGFTIIHRFGEEIGADQGERTRCIRIDGDHGHPIIESGSKTSFDSYIRREIRALKEKGVKGIELLTKLLKYLEGIDYAQYFEKDFPKDRGPDSDSEDDPMGGGGLGAPMGGGGLGAVAGGGGRGVAV